MAETDTGRRQQWSFQWKELYDEVITSGLCTGCAGCVISCPHDVIGYPDGDGHGGYRPFHLEEELGPANCLHGEKGCTSCTRACPRFRAWEVEADAHLWGRERRVDEPAGVYKDVILARASRVFVHEKGQDGGLVSAILIYCLENGLIDAALVSYLEGDGSTWRAVPGVARHADDVLASAGSRYTYSANTLAFDEAVAGGAEKIALVGMSCQSAVPPVMEARKIGKVGRRFALNIGLLCSKAFDERIFEELFAAKYGIERHEIKKMNIKGVFQIWLHDGRYVEVPLKECHAWTREECKCCPDFAAEHADIATGGIGAFNDWTLTIVRTDLGREILVRMLEDGWIEGRPGDDDPGAVALMRKLAVKSRKRWPGWAAETSVELQAAKPGLVAGRST